jgi:transcriptional regulator with XRE-family HTH domain
MYMAKLVRPRFKKPKYRPTFIRQWRTYRQLTLQQVADRVGTTHATLSRIERGVQPYNQPLLEQIATALQTDPASLLIRNPTDPEAIWTIWENAGPGARKQIRAIAETIAKTGT